MPRPSQDPLEVGTHVQASTRAELERLGMLDSPEGQGALAMAAALDSGRSLMAAPAMLTALRAAMDALRERTPKAKDRTDEFTARRAARRAAAGF